MKKSQFASLHAGMMVRASRPVHESMEMTMANDDELRRAVGGGGAAVARATETAPQQAEPQQTETPVWRSDKPLSFATWEQLRAELLPPGWGRSAPEVEAELSVLDPAAPETADPATASLDDNSRADSEAQPLRQRGGFGRRSTPPPAGEIDDMMRPADAAPAAAPSPEVDDSPAVAGMPPVDETGADDAHLAHDADDAIDHDAIDVEYVDIADEAINDTPRESLSVDGEESVASADDVLPTAVADDADIAPRHEAEAFDADKVPADEVIETPAVVPTAATDDVSSEPEAVAPAKPAVTPATGETTNSTSSSASVPAVAVGRRKAMTVRLDAPRHRRLKLAGVYYGRSCQEMMVSALDAYLAQLGFGAEDK